MKKTNNFEDLAIILRPEQKSILEMSKAELNEIDKFQTINRGFVDAEENNTHTYFNWED